ncbi:hypothetical protein KMW28_19375 [Flammeovirga yaeyamensis]|uniref:Uncharacterized protein n=1 Tax=Flammeovirga yaeyamensis TaxID=367791 RepID=A0AAX1N7K1_9BACT|nr:hypothetical protein [Flammeovirga yaeyamensis]MBB3700785.1 hypothetical protein [Flammeovirga yaeyamensis]NMF37860.1 hypothetical protein [Flammeovirga yaeyamensis]QWG01778.1 hypothetical protein KMW28_19375 [Flammeovirga yaeyamensis]
MKLIIVSTLTLFTFALYGQSTSSHASEQQWNALKLYATDADQKEVINNKINELNLLKEQLHHSVIRELEEIETLSINLLQNFVIIEEHLREHFFEMDLHYLEYELQHPDHIMTKEEWVEFHTEKIKKYKISQINDELPLYYD